MKTVELICQVYEIWFFFIVGNSIIFVNKLVEIKFVLKFLRFTSEHIFGLELVIPLVNSQTCF